jgi:hypothetical protein
MHTYLSKNHLPNSDLDNDTSFERFDKVGKTATPDEQGSRAPGEDKRPTQWECLRSAIAPCGNKSGRQEDDKNRHTPRPTLN